jgi:hypothetical protein
VESLRYPEYCAARHPDTGKPITVSKGHGMLPAPDRFDVELFNRLMSISQETVQAMLRDYGHLDQATAR